MSIIALNAIDSYKTSHKDQYPPGTTEVYSNATFRFDHHAKVHREFYDGRVVFFGLQGYIWSHLVEAWNETFFHESKEVAVYEYKRRVDNLLNTNFDVSHIAALHDLGYLPIEIRALPEGALVPLQVPAYTVHNTHPDFAWLTNYLESGLQSETWKMSTNATVAYNFRKIISHWAELTGSPDYMVPWQGHDFSMRGMSGLEDAARSGAAHLTSFCGTDNLLGMDYAEKYYAADAEIQVLGGSVPATEHSTMTIGGVEGEKEVIERIMGLYPTGIVSMVLDGFDYFNAINETLPSLKDKIMALSLIHI